MEHIQYKTYVYAIIKKEDDQHIYFSQFPFMVSKIKNKCLFQIIRDTYFSYKTKLNQEINLTIIKITMNNYITYGYHNCIFNKKYEVFWNINIIMDNDNINKESISIEKDQLTFTIELYKNSNNLILMLPSFTISY